MIPCDHAVGFVCTKIVCICGSCNGQTDADNANTISQICNALNITFFDLWPTTDTAFLVVAASTTHTQLIQWPTVVAATHTQTHTQHNTVASCQCIIVCLLCVWRFFILFSLSFSFVRPSATTITADIFWSASVCVCLLRPFLSFIFFFLLLVSADDRL